MSIRLAWRSIWRNRRRTLITLFSMAMGLTVAIFFIAFGDGMYYQLVDDAARMQSGHVTIEHTGYRTAPAVDLFVRDAAALRERIGKLPGVKLTKRIVQGQAVARSGRDSVGVAVLGVEPSVEKQTSPLIKHVTKGKYLTDGDHAMIVIGARLAEQLEVGLGSKVVLTANNADGDLVENLFRIKGIYKTGTDEIDGYMVQATVDDVASLYGLPEGAATQIGVVAADPADQDAVFGRVKAAVTQKDVAVLPWQKIMPDLAAYIRMDKSSNIVFQGILIFIIMFTLFNTILMSVMERKREFAVLMAVGTPVRLMRAQVVAEAVLLGLVGSVLGMFLGWLVSEITRHTGIDMSRLMKEGTAISGFAINLVAHPRASLEILLWPTGLVFVSTVLLSFVAIRRVRDDDIADTLRHT